jgi:hypothetical protein
MRATSFARRKRSLANLLRLKLINLELVASTKKIHQQYLLALERKKKN